MGEVYAAADEDLDREVAIKVLGSAVDVEPHRRRFLREARLAARLNHPNIASIHEVGDSDGRRYIVMELLEGETLRALLSERHLPIGEALTIARDVARALARAHAGEVIHRDIKPENIFITRPAPDLLLAKVLDFGLARDELVRNKNDDEDTATDITGPGQACGTAGYLAPEQARGLAIDVRADVFSFGAVFYEMLTGKRAFDGKNQLARMLAVVKHGHEPLRSLLPDLSPDIEAVVDRCLSKTPDDRYADGSALLAAVESLVRSHQRSSASDFASGRLRLEPGLDATGPKIPPALASSPSIAQDPWDGAPGAARRMSHETPAPSTQSQRVPALPRTFVEQHWALVVAGGGGLVVALIIIALSASSSTESARAPSAAASHFPVVSAARELGGEGAAKGPAASADLAPDDAPDDDGERTSPTSTSKEKSKEGKVGVSGTASSRPSPRADKRPPASASFTRLPTDPPHPPHPLNPPHPPPAALAPSSPARAQTPASVEASTTGTIRFQGVEVLTVVIDGEHRRLRNDSVTLACGRHRVRVGLNSERAVDVPCGGSILF